jgi:TonB family protein
MLWSRSFSNPMARFAFVRYSCGLTLGLLLLPGSAAPQGSAPSPVQVLSARDATRLLMNQIKPDYPPIAHANYIEGQVQMELTVGPDGHVRKAHVIRGHPLLAASALKAIRHWIYRPFVGPAGPTPFSTEVKVVFDLRDLHRERDRFPTTPERDLARQVTPPTVLQRSSDPSTDSLIRMRVLVGDDGHAIDSTFVSGPVASFESAQHQVSEWRFEPARWGNLTVPWYLDLDVPVDSHEPSRAAVEMLKP